MEHFAKGWTISVIIPVYNGGENFRTCLQSLGQMQPPPAEIIVVADGDTDGSWRWAEQFGARTFRTSTPQGPAHARNLGASKAQGDICFFIDADVAVAPDALRQIINAFNSKPDLAAVFGSYDDQPAATNFLSQYKNLFHHYVHQTASEEASTFWSGCGAIRRDIFLALGGFRTSYRQPCIEDIELGYRIKRAGYRIQLCKNLQGKHLKRWNAVSLVKTDFFQRALPWTELILRDNQLVNDLNLGNASRASVLSVYGLLTALLCALWWSGFLVIASILGLFLMMLNAPVYRFFLRKRGLPFSLGVIPWHWFYYFYSGFAFFIGIIQYLTPRWIHKPTGTPVT